MCCLNFVAKVLATACGLLFVIIIPVSLWILNFTQVGLETETYLEPFRTEGFYENLVPLILPAMAENAHQNPDDPTDDVMLPGELRFGDVVNNLDQDDWNQIAKDIVPAEYVQEEIESNWSAILGYARGDEPFLDVTFNTGVVRDNLLGPPGDRMVNRIFNTWPDCTPLEETAVKNFIDKKTDIFPYCKPTDTVLQNNTFALLTTSKNELAEDIPEIFVLREEIAKTDDITIEQVDQNLYDAIQRPIALELALAPLTILLPCALLALIVILAVSSSKSFFGWIGWPVALAGIATLLPLGILPLMLPALTTGGGDVDAVQGEALRSVMRALIVSFTQPILVQGAFMVAAGFISLFIAVLMPDPDEEDMPVFYSGGSTPMYPMPMQTPPPVSAAPTPPPARTPPPVQPQMPPQPKPFSSSQKKQEDSSPRRIRVPIEVKKSPDEE